MPCRKINLFWKCSWIILIALCSVSVSYSQDLLVKMNGDTLVIKVVEIQESFLVYHKSKVSEERVFTTHRRKLEKIIYGNGDVFVFADEPFMEEGDDESSSKGNYELDVKVDSYMSYKSGFLAPSILHNGYKLSAAEVKEIYADYPDALHSYTSGRTSNIIGNIIGFSFRI